MKSPMECVRVFSMTNLLHPGVLACVPYLTL